jgi:ribosomal protein S18 acetylase RimI-like enzyme
VRVRPGTPADAGAIIAVRIASWRGAYGAYLPANYWDEYDRATATHRTADAISSGRWDVFVAETDSIIGYVIYGAARDDDVPPGTGEVYAIYVHPDAWSTGAGRALMDAALAAFGDRTVVLWVLTVNERARRFYDLAGFVADGAEKDADMPGGTIPELRYRRG